MKRWRATVYYRTDNGTVDVEHDFDELADLHVVVENGPSWDAIERIEIVLTSPSYPSITVEAANDQ